MRIRFSLALAALALVCSASLSGQSSGTAAAKPTGTALQGTWRVDAASVTKSGPREVIIRADSSASWGKETVRWRLPTEGKIMIALGGEWETYRMKLKGDKLTLSGGDLSEPITLKRTGPATPLPPGVAVPPDPDTVE